jgi:hypothetical protein
MKIFQSNWLACCIAISFVTGCSPRIIVDPSRKPIVINMNIKLDHDVHIKHEDRMDTATCGNRNQLQKNEDRQSNQQMGASEPMPNCVKLLKHLPSSVSNTATV